MRRSRILIGAGAALLVAGAAVATFGDDADRLRTGVANSYGDDALVAPVDRTSDKFSGSTNDGAAAGATGGRTSADVAVGGTTASEALAAPAGPRVVKTASLTVSVKRAVAVRDATQAANSIAERLGGYVASTEASTGERAASTLTLRVPVTAYDAALRELRGLGRVENESLGGNDVTGALVDLDARLASLRAQESALNVLMAKAANVGETLQVAQAVAGVRTQIEQLAAQQKQLSDQADFATITLRVAGPNAAIDGEPEPKPVLARAIERAAGGALEVLGGAIVVVGYAAPAALIAALGYAAVHLYRRRGAEVA